MFYQQRSTVCHHSPCLSRDVATAATTAIATAAAADVDVCFTQFRSVAISVPGTHTHTHVHSLGDNKLPLSLDPEGGQITLTDHHPRREAPPALPRNCARRPRQGPQRNR